MDIEKNNLLDAVDKGKIEEVKALLKEGMDVHTQDNKGRSALMIATLNNDLEMSKLLIDQGADVNQRDNMLLTPWIAAATNGYHQILKAGAHKANVTLVNRFGGTALHPSSEKGFLKAVDVALQAGVPVNVINKLEWTALQEVAILGDGKSLFRLIARTLMDHGADPTTVDNYGKTALDYVKEYHQPYMEALLKKEVDRTQADEMLIDEILKEISNEKYEQAIEKANQGLKDFHRLEFYFLKGYNHTLMGEIDKAIEVYKEGLEQPEGEPEFYLYLANAYREKGEVDKALDYFYRGIDVNPNHFYYRYHLSNYLRQLGRHEEAINQMDKLLEQNPKRYDYAFHKANSLRVLGREEEADQVLKQFD